MHSKPKTPQDALLSTSRLELFKQGVDIVSAGDSANELYLIVAGTVQIRCASLVALWLLVSVVWRCSHARIGLRLLLQSLGCVAND